MEKPKILFYGNDDDFNGGIPNINMMSTEYAAHILQANGIDVDIATHRKIPTDIFDYKLIGFRGNPQKTREGREKDMDLLYGLSDLESQLSFFSSPASIAANNLKQNQGAPELSHLFPQGTTFIDATNYSSNDITEMLREDLNTYGPLVMKPGNGYGGKGLMKIENDEKTRNSLGTMVTNYLNEFVSKGYISQKFVPEIANSGDYRVIMLDGKIASWLRRVPADGDYRSNISSGGTMVKVDSLPEKVEQTALATAPYQLKNGFGWVGADVGDDGTLLELNVYSPGGGSQSDVININKNFQKGIVNMVYNRLGMSLPEKINYVPLDRKTDLTIGR